MEIVLGPVASGLLTTDQVASSALFSGWYKQISQHRTVRWVEVHDALVGGDGTVKILQATGTYEGPGGDYRRMMLLRGATVEILPLLDAPSGKFLVYVSQIREPYGRVVTSNPAGMVDVNESLSAAMGRELTEEVGELDWRRIGGLNKFAIPGGPSFIVSPGGSDETADFGLLQASVTEAQLEVLEGALGGLAAENEQTTLRICPLDHAYEYLARAAGSNGAVDLKTVMALMLYERENIMQGPLRRASRYGVFY